MISYPAKPYVIPHDDWFNNNSTNFENKSKTKGSKNISTAHEFFYRESAVKVGGSDNHIETNLEKKSLTKIIIASSQNSDKSFLSRNGEKYSYSKIPKELKSIKKRSFEGINFYKQSSNKNIFNFRSYFEGLKSVFFKVISKRKRS